MCRMLAKVSSTEESARYELLDAPHSLFEQSKCGRQPENPDVCGAHASGCGIAFVAGREIPVERRGPDENWDESYREFVRGISTKILIAHNRKATPGLRVDRSCSHPFTSTFKGSQVAFCHNGTVFNLEEEAKRRGVADSEVFFEQLLAGVPALTADAISRQLCTLAREYRFTSLSGLLLVPTGVFAWRIHGKDPGNEERFSKYYTLHLRRTPSAAVIASEPVDSASGWKLARNGAFYSLTAEAGIVAVEERLLQI